MRQVEKGSSLLEREAHLLSKESWARDSPCGGHEQLLLELPGSQASRMEQTGLEVVPPLLSDPAHLRNVAVADSEHYLLAFWPVPLQQRLELVPVYLERVQLLT